MGRLLPYRRAIFAIQGHVKYAATELLHQLLLQLQAFTHALFNAAVVVAYRQRNGASLRAQQHLRWVDGRDTHN